VRVLADTDRDHICPHVPSQRFGFGYSSDEKGVADRIN
jgi:hypothetical protein